MEQVRRLEVIALCGMMGSGKSTLGRLLAAKLKARFTDLDRLIVKREGKGIPEIFKKGEAAFRRAESRALASVPQGRRVLALGGGALGRPANRALLKRRGVTVYLKVSEAELWRRLSRRGLATRPLLRQGGRKALSSLLKRRVRLYERADFTVAASGSKPQVLAKLLKTLKKAGF